MNNPYDVHAWSKQYRKDVLHEVQAHRLAERARTNRREAWARVRYALAKFTSLLFSALEEYDEVSYRRP